MPKSVKNSKQGWLIGLLIGAVVIGGGIGLYAYFSGKDKDNKNDEDDEGGGDYLPPVTNPDTVDLFSSLPLGTMPLKKGSKNKLVFILQKYLNCRFNSGLEIDGNFGSKTEAALNKSLGVKTIASRVALDSIVKGKVPANILGACEQTLDQKMREFQ